MSTNNRGPLFEETIEAGGIFALGMNSQGTLSGSADAKVQTNLAFNGQGILTSTGTDAKNSVKAGMDGQGTLTGVLDAFALYPSLETSKLSEYTIARSIQNHTEQANENLIMEFKNCPNILKLLETPLLELDQASLDVRAFQEFVVNIEEAQGVNLDLLGLILGVNRVLPQDDNQYRAILLSQVQVITCDGTLTKILVAMLMRYNHSLDGRSRDKVTIRTLTHNIYSAYVYNYLDIVNSGGAPFINSLTPAGAEARILVNDTQVTDLGEYFTLDNSINNSYAYNTYDWPLANPAPIPNTVADFLAIVGETLDLGTIPLIDIPAGDILDNVAAHSFGTFRILRAGDYTFRLQSLDGSRLFIDGLEVVANDDGTLGSVQTTESLIFLSKGVHNLDVIWAHRTGAEQLTLDYKGPDNSDTYGSLFPFRIGDDSEVGTGLGLGSIEDTNDTGGGLTGQYNQDPNGTILFPFGLEGSVGTLGLNEGQFISSVVTFNHAQPVIKAGVPTPTTTSLIPVPTFPT